jgi:hypothetical protein
MRGELTSSTALPLPSGEKSQTPNCEDLAASLTALSASPVERPVDRLGWPIGRAPLSEEFT